jgi:hypothetical protein
MDLLVLSVGAALWTLGATVLCIGHYSPGICSFGTGGRSDEARGTMDA